MIHQKIAKKSMIDRFLDSMVGIDRKVITIFILVFVLGISFFGYNLWMRSYNASMNAYFGPLIVEYNKAVAQNKDLDSLKEQFERGIQNYSRSSGVMYYQSYVVSLLLQQNKVEQAHELLSAITQKGGNSSLAHLYAMDQALLDLDSQDGAQQEQGELRLKELASNNKNPFFDTALFYLGRYYWAHDKIDQARETWQTLVDAFVDQRVGISPWVDQAKEYLKITIV